MPRQHRSHSGYETFPQTVWQYFDELGTENPQRRMAAVAHLIERYWKPAYCYLRLLRVPKEKAEEYTQEFFVDVVKKNLFAKADRTRGRFRNFLKTCLRNFVIDKSRSAPNGREFLVTDLESIADSLAASDNTAPDEERFEVSWWKQLIRRTMVKLEEWASKQGREKHLHVFERLVLEPAYSSGAGPMSRKDLRQELVRQLHVTERELYNLLTVAKRAFVRFLKEEVRFFAFNEEDQKEEVAEILRWIKRFEKGRK
jgi:RNA polymerase sigma-70 factor (ECF subfamily)